MRHGARWVSIGSLQNLLRYCMELYAGENMIIIQTSDARPWVHDRGRIGHHPRVVPRRSLDWIPIGCSWTVHVGPGGSKPQSAPGP